MKEFNLDEFKKNPSQKVITRDGRDVRIVCTDANNDFPIIALICCRDSKEDVRIYKENGCTLPGYESPNDLFFAPIKREGWVNLFKDRSGAYLSISIYETEQRAKEVIGEKHTTYLATIKIEWEE